jgi:transcriptional regulator with XRE-family HTH domain
MIMIIGELLATTRELQRMTLRELEKRSGVSNALISQIETGHVINPGFFTVVALAKALRIPIEQVARAKRNEKRDG